MTETSNQEEGFMPASLEGHEGYDENAHMQFLERPFYFLATVEGTILNGDTVLKTKKANMIFETQMGLIDQPTLNMISANIPRTLLVNEEPIPEPKFQDVVILNISPLGPQLPNEFSGKSQGIQVPENVIELAEAQAED